MFAKGAQFISNNVGCHFYKLTGDDIALVYSAILILMFITAIGSTQEFTVCISGLFALSLAVYILSTMYGPNSNNSIQNMHSDGLPYVRNGCWNRLGDCLLVVLSLAMQSVDLSRREDAAMAPYRLSAISAIYMFTLTGIRKNCLILVWFISMIFRLTVAQTTSVRVEVTDPEYSGSFVTSVVLAPTLSIIDSLHHFGLGLFLYEFIYLVGTEIVRLRLRPRVILQDIPNITKIEHSVFSIFYHQYNLLPPISLSQYDHLLLLLHISKHQVLARLHVRQKRMFSKLQAELIRQTIHGASASEVENSTSQVTKQESLDEEALDAKIKNVRMRERVWSMGLRFEPSNIMFRGKMQSSENLTRAVNEEEALWPWHSKEAIIIEASLPARYQDFKTTRYGPFTDVKLERWFLAWSLVSIVRLLTSAQKIFIGYLLLLLLSNVGVFNDIGPSVIVNGFRTNLALALYVLRLGSFLLCTAILLPNIIYNSSHRQLEWVDLAEKQILKYRAFAIYLIINGILDWLVVAEQFADSVSHNHFLGRSASFLQQITFIPFLLAVPPHVVAYCLALSLVILLTLTAWWPVTNWQIFYDISLVLGSCAACVLFISVPYYKVLRALFATYAAPYLLYLEALRPRENLPKGSQDEAEGKRHESFEKTIRSSIRANTHTHLESVAEIAC